jgi:hypothetical protein
LFERFALLAALVVVAGLVVEFGPELREALVKRVLPSREVQGSIIVTLGVMAEAFLSWRALVYARRAELDAEERMAESVERSRQAEQAASEANLERVKLEERLADRRVSSLQMKILKRDLEKFSGGTLWIYGLEDNEAIRFSKELAFSLEYAGLKVQFRKFDPDGSPPGLSMASGLGTEDLADAIERAFIAAGLVMPPMDRILNAAVDGMLVLKVGSR